MSSVPYKSARNARRGTPPKKTYPALERVSSRNQESTSSEPGVEKPLETQSLGLQSLGWQNSGLHPTSPQQLGPQLYGPHGPGGMVPQPSQRQGPQGLGAMVSQPSQTFVPQGPRVMVPQPSQSHGPQGFGGMVPQPSHHYGPLQPTLPSYGPSNQHLNAFQHSSSPLSGLAVSAIPTGFQSVHTKAYWGVKTDDQNRKILVARSSPASGQASRSERPNLTLPSSRGLFKSQRHLPVPGYMWKTLLQERDEGAAEHHLPHPTSYQPSTSWLSPPPHYYRGQDVEEQGHSVSSISSKRRAPTDSHNIRDEDRSKSCSQTGASPAKRHKAASAVSPNPISSANSVAGETITETPTTSDSIPPNPQKLSKLPADALTVMAGPSGGLQLVIKVPPGQSGSFVVDLHPNFLKSLLTAREGSEDKSLANPQANWHETARVPGLKPRFLGLPAEIRNKIYQYLFRDSKPVDFTSASNLCRSSSLLGACRLVHAEARDILYGENAFIFTRQHRLRGEYFEEWKEVGYRDVEGFLRRIGQDNLSRIPEIFFRFEDAMPSITKEWCQDRRRYINDRPLHYCLRLLGRNGRFKKLTLDLLGRRNLSTLDSEFLTILKCISGVEELRFTKTSKFGPTVDWDIKDRLTKAKTRKPFDPDFQPGKPLRRPAKWTW
ncbi:MAG: hypothetical protein M4579_006969 [Chaenotheca gracillima]|nr:MAG: hypothetical protein M4579_006969 [Chaenotheca gracillima]